jgi:hypothetical protein
MLPNLEEQLILERQKLWLKLHFLICQFDFFFLMYHSSMSNAILNEHL